ncbi:MAG: hypothetical protein PUP92_30420, partial [Rhizonema sp. PD38]|nr:hypothetical protein [Rhizonema sp. PD38]
GEYCAKLAGQKILSGRLRAKSWGESTLSPELRDYDQRSSLTAGHLFLGNMLVLRSLRRVPY